MYAILFRSIAVKEIETYDLLDILVRARRRNAEREITGVLFYTGVGKASGPPSDRADQFVQWIEGPEQAVRDLYDAVCPDPRHYDCEILAEGTMEELLGHGDRLFSAWSFRGERVSALPITPEAVERVAMAAA